jgi:beta-galactosidase
MQGTSDLPHYTNIQMPFPCAAGTCPTCNPTGVYRRTFDRADGWRSQQVVLHIGGAESVHAVYVNDRFVGYGTDSRLPSEYDVTDARPGGEHHLAVVVVRYSAQSYVEDQDQWWMAGLHRSVSIEARSRCTCADVEVRTLFAPPDVEVVARTSLTVTVPVEVSSATSPGYVVRGWLCAGRRRDASVRCRRRRTCRTCPTPIPYVFEGHRRASPRSRRRVQPWSPSRRRCTGSSPNSPIPTGRWSIGSQRTGFRTVEVSRPAPAGQRCSRSPCSV